MEMFSFGGVKERMVLMLCHWTTAPVKLFAPPMNPLIHCNLTNPHGIELYVDSRNEPQSSYDIVRSKNPSDKSGKEEPGGVLGSQQAGTGPATVPPIRGVDSKPRVRGSLCVPTEELQMDEERWAIQLISGSGRTTVPHGETIRLLAHTIHMLNSRRD